MINKYIKILKLYFKVTILNNTNVKGYTFKKVGNLPIVGVNHFEGYELINPKTNKVLYRKIKNWGYIGDGFRSYNPDKYETISIFFFKNI